MNKPNYKYTVEIQQKLPFTYKNKLYRPPCKMQVIDDDELNFLKMSLHIGGIDKYIVINNIPGKKPKPDSKSSQVKVSTTIPMRPSSLQKLKEFEEKFKKTKSKESK